MELMKVPLEPIRACNSQELPPLVHLRKQIRDNAVTVLTGLSTTGGRAYASRLYLMTAANLPGLCVCAKSEEVETTTITRPRTQVRTLTLSVEGFAVATSTACSPKMPQFLGRRSPKPLKK
jgi:hypothetical protein